MEREESRWHCVFRVVTVEMPATYPEAVSPRKRGIRDKMAALYEENADAATRLAYVLTGDQALAQDLVQEAFVRVFSRFAERRDPDSFESYLRATVINLARSHWRRRTSERGYLKSQRPAQAVQDFAPDVAERDAIWSALMTLPRRQRGALYLRYYEDLSEQQVADCLACSLPAARSLLLRGRKAINEVMKEFTNG